MTHQVLHPQIPSCLFLCILYAPFPRYENLIKVRAPRQIPSNSFYAFHTRHSLGMKIGFWGLVLLAWKDLDVGILHTSLFSFIECGLYVIKCFKKIYAYYLYRYTRSLLWLRQNSPKTQNRPRGQFFWLSCHFVISHHFALFRKKNFRSVFAKIYGATFWNVIGFWWP